MEYVISGLITRQILTKTGEFEMSGKFHLAAWEFILIRLAGAWGASKKSLSLSRKLVIIRILFIHASLKKSQVKME